MLGCLLQLGGARVAEDPTGDNLHDRAATRELLFLLSFLLCRTPYTSSLHHNSLTNNFCFHSTAKLSDNKGLHPFIASSPPPWNAESNFGGRESVVVSSLGAQQEQLGGPSAKGKEPEGTAPPPAAGPSSPAPQQASPPRLPPSKIGILPTSLPSYHNQWWKMKKLGIDINDQLYAPEESQFDTEPHGRPQTSEEQAETARRLKPHSRSQVKLDDSSKPAGMTPVPAKKSKPSKWQFGIRSRNSPVEAIACIYRALQKQGADWLREDGLAYTDTP